MRVAISLRLANDDWAAASTWVTEAERLGVDCVWSAEAWGHDAVTPLAFLAARTTRIGLGSGIVQAGTRTPALVAMTAMSLASMSGNRFRLGLGVSGPQVIEGWHGIRFDRPVRRMRETVEIVRQLCRGERSSYRGEIYELPLPGGEGKPLRAGARPQPAVPIYLATLAPRSLELTGEIAQGWLGTSFMPEHAQIFTGPLAAGAARAGRALADLDLQAGGAVAFGDDLERLIAPRKPGLAFTLGAMGSRQHNFYNEARGPCSSSGSRDGARRRPRACPTGWCSSPTCWAPTRWSARASARTATPGSRRCVSSRPRGCWRSGWPPSGA